MAEEMTYNEARNEAARLKNLLRVFERADAVLQAAEMAEGIVKTHGPQVDELKAKREQAVKELQETQAQLEDGRRHLADINAQGEIARGIHAATLKEINAEEERAREDRGRRVKETDQRAKVEQERRLRELDREYEERKKNLHQEIEGLIADREKEAQKLAAVKAELRETAQRAAQAAGG